MQVESRTRHASSFRTALRIALQAFVDAGMTNDRGPQTLRHVATHALRHRLSGNGAMLFVAWKLNRIVNRSGVPRIGR